MSRSLLRSLVTGTFLRCKYRNMCSFVIDFRPRIECMLDECRHMMFIASAATENTKGNVKLVIFDHFVLCHEHLNKLFDTNQPLLLALINFSWLFSRSRMRSRASTPNLRDPISPAVPTVCIFPCFFVLLFFQMFGSTSAFICTNENSNNTIFTCPNHNWLLKAAEYSAYTLYVWVWG